MVDTQSFTAVSASATSLGGNADSPPSNPEVSTRWRTAVLAAIIAVNATVAVWLFLDVTQLLRTVPAGVGADLLNRMTQWRELAVQKLVQEQGWLPCRARQQTTSKIKPGNDSC